MDRFSTFKRQKYNFIMKLEISADALSAYLSIFEDDSTDEEGDIFQEDIMEFIEEHSISYGIKIDEIKRIANDKILNFRVQIAQGKPKMDGENSHVKLNFKITRDNKPKTDEKGRIDFKELNNINNVVKDQVLAEKTLPTKGEDGFDVFGRILKASMGKNIEFKIGKNVKLSEDGLKLISESDGSVEFADGWINVNKVMNIENDVDTSTGNIRFNGDVVVNGDIKTGFLVQAEGNVHVRGVIEGAIVDADGAIVVEGGIQGNDRAEIKAKKGLTCRYIENAKKVSVQGDVTTDFIIHSNVECFGSIVLMASKSMIVGGYIFAQKNINTEFLGSTMETKTLVDVGIEENIKIKLQAYQDEKEFVLKNLKNLNESLEMFKKAMNSSAVDPEKKKLIQKSVNTYNGLAEKLKIVNAEIKKIQSQMESIKDGFVNVRGRAYPGVKITIGNHTRYIRNETEFCRFVIEDNDIVSKTI